MLQVNAFWIWTLVTIFSTQFPFSDGHFPSDRACSIVHGFPQLMDDFSYQQHLGHSGHPTEKPQTKPLNPV